MLRNLKEIKNMILGTKLLPDSDMAWHSVVCTFMDSNDARLGIQDRDIDSLLLMSHEAQSWIQLQCKTTGHSVYFYSHVGDGWECTICPNVHGVELVTK